MTSINADYRLGAGIQGKHVSKEQALQQFADDRAMAADTMEVSVASEKCFKLPKICESVDPSLDSILPSCSLISADSNTNSIPSISREETGLDEVLNWQQRLYKMFRAGIPSAHANEAPEIRTEKARESSTELTRSTKRPRTQKWHPTTFKDGINQKDCVHGVDPTSIENAGGFQDPRFNDFVTLLPRPTKAKRASSSSATEVHVSGASTCLSRWRRQWKPVQTEFHSKSKVGSSKKLGIGAKLEKTPSRILNRVRPKQTNPNRASRGQTLIHASLEDRYHQEIAPVRDPLLEGLSDEARSRVLKIVSGMADVFLTNLPPELRENDARRELVLRELMRMNIVYIAQMMQKESN